MPQEIEIDRFMARTDLGKQYLIIVYQEYMPTGTYKNPFGEVEGRRRLTTSTGLDVIYSEPGRYYKILMTDELLRKA